MEFSPVGADCTIRCADMSSASPEGCKDSVISIRSELLCFIYDKERVMTMDHLIKICVDFYKDDEILAAWKIIVGDDIGLRLPKRTGPSKSTATIKDIIKTVLNPANKLPSFHAVDFSRLPPADVTHCDVSAILNELQSLRQEVRSVRDLREEVERLRVRTSDYDQLRSDLTLTKNKLNAVVLNLISVRNSVASLQNVADVSSGEVHDMSQHAVSLPTLPKSIATSSNIAATPGNGNIVSTQQLLNKQQSVPHDSHHVHHQSSKQSLPISKPELTKTAIVLADSGAADHSV